MRKLVAKHQGILKILIFSHFRLKRFSIFSVFSHRVFQTKVSTSLCRIRNSSVRSSEYDSQYFIRRLPLSEIDHTLATFVLLSIPVVTLSLSLLWLAIDWPNYIYHKYHNMSKRFSCEEWWPRIWTMNYLFLSDMNYPIESHHSHVRKMSYTTIHRGEPETLAAIKYSSYSRCPVIGLDTCSWCDSNRCDKRTHRKVASMNDVIIVAA